MTKPKPPEFTDYASAREYLKHGRGSGGRKRSTSDGWNTTIEHVAADQVALVVSGIHRVLWFDDGSVAVTIKDLDFVARERINRYLLGPRNLELASNSRAITKFFTFQGEQPVTVSALWADLSPGVTGFTFDKTGFMTSGGSAHLPINRPTFNKPAWIRQFLRGLEQPKYAKHNTCAGCRALTDDVWDSLGALLGDQDHMLAHLIGMQFPDDFAFSLAWQVSGGDPLRAAKWLNLVGPNIGPVTFTPADVHNYLAAVYAL